MQCLRATSSVPAPMRLHGTVLVIDDDPWICSSVADLLTHEPGGRSRPSTRLRSSGGGATNLTSAIGLRTSRPLAAKLIQTAARRWVSACGSRYQRRSAEAPAHVRRTFRPGTASGVDGVRRLVPVANRSVFQTSSVQKVIATLVGGLAHGVADRVNSESTRPECPRCRDRLPGHPARTTAPPLPRPSVARFARGPEATTPTRRQGTR